MMEALTSTKKMYGPFFFGGGTCSCIRTAADLFLAGFEA